MDYSEVKKLISSIREGNYQVDYEEPNNIESCTAPDGRTFYKVADLDGPRSSTNFGACYVEVNGYHFTFDWGCEYYEDRVESDFFDQLEESEFDDDIDDDYDIDSIIDEIMEEFEKRDDIYIGPYTDVDGQMEVYAMIHDLSDPEYYYYDDEDCPIDIDSSWQKLTPPKELAYGTVEYEGKEYYLVEDPSDADLDAIYAVRSDEAPGDHGEYSTVIMQLEENDEGYNVLSLEDSDDKYDSCEKSMLLY
jgi:hypothetical protein